jgi:hypothetical protein
MKTIVERCAGIEAGKNRLNVCVMTGAADRQKPAPHMSTTGLIIHLCTNEPNKFLKLHDRQIHRGLFSEEEVTQTWKTTGQGRPPEQQRRLMYPVSIRNATG